MVFLLFVSTVPPTIEFEPEGAAGINRRCSFSLREHAGSRRSAVWTESAEKQVVHLVGNRCRVDLQSVGVDTVAAWCAAICPVILFKAIYLCTYLFIFFCIFRRAVG